MDYTSFIFATSGLTAYSRIDVTVRVLPWGRGLGMGFVISSDSAHDLCNLLPGCIVQH